MKKSISDNSGGLWIWQNTVRCGTQMAVLETQDSKFLTYQVWKQPLLGNTGLFLTLYLCPQAFLGSSEPWSVFYGVQCPPGL